MKAFITVLVIAASTLSFGQVVKSNLKTLPKKMNKPLAINNKLETVPLENVFAIKFGDFEIQKFYILKRDTPPTRELKLLLGSFVRVQNKSITGDEIDPLKIKFVGVEKMSRSDYIYRFFGREIRAQEPDLPETVKVHKTNNPDCSGIVEIDKNHLGIPYKGVLLIVERK